MTLLCNNNRENRRTVLQMSVWQVAFFHHIVILLFYCSFTILSYCYSQSVMLSHTNAYFPDGPFNGHNSYLCLLNSFRSGCGDDNDDRYDNDKRKQCWQKFEIVRLWRWNLKLITSSEIVEMTVIGGISLLSSSLSNTTPTSSALLPFDKSILAIGWNWNICQVNQFVIVFNLNISYFKVEYIL